MYIYNKADEETGTYNGGQNSLGHLSNCINFLCFQNGVLKKALLSVLNCVA